jgi:hypothetical protein
MELSRSGPLEHSSKGPSLAALYTTWIECRRFR